MTPRMFFELRKRQVGQWQREELLFGIVASTTANFSFSPPKRALTPESFMMHPFKTQRPDPPASKQGDALLSMLQAMPPELAVQVE